MTTTPTSPIAVNIASRLQAMAHRMPDAIAVAEPLGYAADGKRRYRQVTFAELDRDSDSIARGLWARGVESGTRLAVLVRPGIDFVSLVFALFKAGAVAILIDPGMGPRNAIRCLAEVQPDGFVAIPLAQAVRAVLGSRFPRARLNVTVGRRWFWGGVTLDQLRTESQGGKEPAPTTANDPAAIIFTTGSTGPPKGVLYTHGNFDAQVVQIRDCYGIQPGEIDLPGFPLFGLFNAAMGVTTIIPDMDPSRPAKVDPRKFVEAIHDWKVTQSFGSPAIWNRVGRYCRQGKIQLPTLRRVMSAGAPVPVDVLQRMRACIAPEGEVYTPYGATEALPVASISASEILGEGLYSGAQGNGVSHGDGVCVGRRFADVQWKVIRVVDGPIERLADVEPLPAGQVGELIVCGPQVTRCYVTRREANTLGKIADADDLWHRMGDAGYRDQADRFWFCGRVAHRVLTAAGPMYTVPSEAVFNQHDGIYRSALVGIGPPGQQRPVIVLEPVGGRIPRGGRARRMLLAEIRRLGQANPRTERIEDFLFHRSFPVDIRHNAKIFREKLAVWAAGKLSALD